MLDESGSRVIYITAIGQNPSSAIVFGLAGVAVDDQGQAIIAGRGPMPVTIGAHALSSELSTSNFVAKLDSEGRRLVYSTYVDSAVITQIPYDTYFDAPVVTPAGSMAVSPTGTIFLAGWGPFHNFQTFPAFSVTAEPAMDARQSALWALPNIAQKCTGDLSSPTLFWDVRLHNNWPQVVFRAIRLGARVLLCDRKALRWAQVTRSNNAQGWPGARGLVWSTWRRAGLGTG